ncbi:MAG: hypothetical protein U0269_22655 [Polyangiales bacterium]
MQFTAPRAQRKGRSTTLLRAATALTAAALLIAPLTAVRAQQQPVATPVVAPAAALNPRVMLAGRYVPAPGAPNAANRDAAVQRSVDSLMFLIRPIAHSRITEANPVFSSVTIAFPPGQIEVVSPPIVARSADNGAEASTTGLDRERNRLTQRIVGNTLVQTTWNDSGARTTRFVPNVGNRLVIQVEVTSPRLPVPVRYAMSFLRTGP